MSVNNYILRSLLGEAAFLLPLDALGLEHVQAARLVLLQLDNLMTLEDSALNDVIFAHGLGWRHTFGVAHARDGSNITHVTEDKLPPELLAFLRHRNELDVKLFHYAHLLQVLDGACFVIAAQAPAGAGGGGEAAAAASTAQPLPQQPSCGFAGLKEHHRRQHESSAPADADTN